MDLINQQNIDEAFMDDHFEKDTNLSKRDWVFGIGLALVTLPVYITGLGVGGCIVGAQESYSWIKSKFNHGSIDKSIEDSRYLR